MAGRCADLMQQAYPGADIDIAKREAAATGLTTIVAHVEGNRTNLPPNTTLARHLAVECKYDERRSDRLPLDRRTEVSRCA